MTRLLTSLTLIALLAVGCGSSDDEKAKDSTANNAQTAAANTLDKGTETTKAPKDASDDAGTRENPIPLGETVTMGDWEVTIVGSEIPATETIRGGNPYMPEPAAGSEWVTVELTATYTGDQEPTSFVTGPLLHLVGATNKELQTLCIPPVGTELPIADDVFKGGTITGNQCFEGAAADLDGLVGYLTNPFEFTDDTTIFVAIK